MCHAVPTVAAIITTFIWSRTRDVKVWWLNLMLWGGAMFGIIDHLWNGELFFIPENLFSDLMLGVTITLAIFVFWKIVMATSSKNQTLAAYIEIKKQ